MRVHVVDKHADAELEVLEGSRDVVADVEEDAPQEGGGDDGVQHLNGEPHLVPPVLQEHAPRQHGQLCPEGRRELRLDERRGARLRVIQEAARRAALACGREV